MTVSTSRNAIGAAERVPKVVYGGLPYLLLLLSSVVAAVDPPGQPPAHLLVTVGLAAVAAVWLLWPLAALPTWPAHRTAILVFYVGLLVIIGVLVARSTAFTLFAALGYAYALIMMPPRLIVWSVAATALVTTVAQGTSVDAANSSIEPYVLAGNIAVPLLFVGWYVGRQSEKRVEMITELEAANARLEVALEENVGLHAQLLTQAREAGVLDERQRMAREIHDTIAQGLTGIITQLQAAEHVTDQPEVHGRHLDNAARLARESLTEARRSVRAMRPEVLASAQLPEALRQVVAGWSGMNRAAAELTTTGTVTALHPEVEVTLLRIAQEALANVAKHSKAGRVRLTLSYFGDVVTLDVRDNGIGFDPAAGSIDRPDGGYGLAGMRQRVERLAGTLAIESEPGAGCALSASVPAIRPGQVLVGGDDGE
ncbi:MAG TPA: sensor histidine kinase [Pseudonocardiaceae bacterium]|nr:sensor histidine kinase [Pseudonocardiaceae bacterium]